jgi:hypothetical protein
VGRFIPPDSSGFGGGLKLSLLPGAAPKLSSSLANKHPSFSPLELLPPGR